MHLSRSLAPAAFLCLLLPVSASILPKPDITVATDGTGDFKTIQAALASIPSTNRERTIVWIKDGTYREKVRVEAPFVTLRGQSRHGVRIEYSQLNDDFTNHPDALGRAVVNLNHADDFVMENLTARNTAGLVGPHAFTVQGTSDRTVLLDCDIFSHGADTVALGKGEGGRHYHARCNLRGSVDFMCPRGWCYMTDCSLYEMKNTAAVWHDGHTDPDMKFVLKNCTFDGVEGWNLARHHVDAQFYFIDCIFSKSMTNLAPFRVLYPGNPQRNAELDKSNLWGERAYFYHCRRKGGDFPWFRNNLQQAANSPAPKHITAAWTFAGSWDPEQQRGPGIRRVTLDGNRATVIFSEPVTVKGKPRLVFQTGDTGDYTAGSGTDTLLFTASHNPPGPVKRLEPNGGAIIASQAAATLRFARLDLPPGN